MKEDNRQIVLQYGFTEQDYKEAAETYVKHPKKKRPQKDEKMMSINQVAEYLEEHQVREPHEFRQALNILRREGRINYTTMLKLQPKRLLSYVREEYELM